MNTGVSYSMFYDILLNLREYFHSYGRIDDSNAKLDEITKFIAMSFFMAKNGEKFSLSAVREKAEKLTGSSENVAIAVRQLFEEVASRPMFLNDDGTNVFGANASLSLQETENEFAEKLISEIEKIDFLNLLNTNSYESFDIINECFGHFVRDNFRNNKEDAQYMTPYELSKPVLDVIFNDMVSDGYMAENNLKNFKIMDPTCGVGTLLIESSNQFTRVVDQLNISKEKKEQLIAGFRKNGIVGQDKVDRMVRLSKINALLLGSNISNIKSGNSISGESSIDCYLNCINLIFTNPPFGAEYELNQLDLDKYPLLKDMNTKPAVIASELLMLDRCIGLLEDGGYLAIVLPDSVFSAKGINSAYRDELLKTISVKGVFELPSVTFAQAGTRTNTCILYARKKKPKKDNLLFMALCKDIGYAVKERAGVPVKIECGINEMNIISEVLIKNNSSDTIINSDPSVTQIDCADLTDNILKPSFYAAERFSAIDSLIKETPAGYEIKKLKEVVDFQTKGRKCFNVSDTIKHISVLHVNADCTIDFNEVEKFNPVSKGRSCTAGELLFSKINPRIPRMAVIPERDYQLVCSNEFEIMMPKGPIGVYTLCFMLRTESVKKQIENLTSGTSSSHSRIKREQLEEILIPVPVSDTEIEKFNIFESVLQNNIEKKYEADGGLLNVLGSLESIVA